MIVPFSFQKRTRLWEPGDAPGIVSHYDASAPGGYTGTSGAVTGLVDLRGYRNLTTAGNGIAPFVGILQNSLQTIELQGAKQFLASSAGDYFTSTGMHWAVMLCSPFSVDNSSDSMWALDGGWRDYQFQAGNATSFYGDLALGNGNSSLFNITNSTNHEGKFTMASVAFDDATRIGAGISTKITSNSGTFVKSGSYSGQIFNSHTLKIAASRNNNQKLPMHFAELFLVAGDGNETVHNTTQLEKAEGYLAHKWGLEANLDWAHPYKASPPVIQD